MTQDFITELGLPFLAHRLRRASDDLVDNVGKWLPEAGIDAPPRSGSTLLLLQREGRLGITEIAARLRLTHPGVIALVAQLEELGLVKIERDEADARRRLVQLTKSGAQTAAQFQSKLQAIGKAYRELFEEIGVDLLRAVEKLEAACERRPLADRIRSKAKPKKAIAAKPRTRVPAS